MSKIIIKRTTMTPDLEAVKSELIESIAKIEEGEQVPDVEYSMGPKEFSELGPEIHYKLLFAVLREVTLEQKQQHRAPDKKDITLVLGRDDLKASGANSVSIRTVSNMVQITLDVSDD